MCVYMYMYMGCYGVVVCAANLFILESENNKKKGCPYKTGFGTTVSLATS